MNTHWPLLLAIALVCGAAFMGYRTQQDILEKSVVTQDIKTLPAKYDATAPMPAPPVAASPAVTVAAPAAVALPRPAALPAQAAPNPQADRVNVPAPVAPVAGDRDAIFANLRNALIQRFRTPAMTTATGYAFAVKGGRIDVDLRTNWSIVIYNSNNAQPTVQSDNFLVIQQLVVANLDIDVNAPTATTGDGKQVRKPTSKLGKLFVVVDPAMNNSMTIKPLPTNNPQAAAPEVNGGNAQQPMLPGQLQQVPAPIRGKRAIQPQVPQTQPANGDQF